MTSLGKRYEHLEKIPEELGIQSALPAPKQAQSQSSGRKRKHIELEPEIRGRKTSYSLVAKAFRVFSIRRQEMEETYHVTFSENDEAITQSSIEDDEINFNEKKSFPDDEFLVQRSKSPISSRKEDYFPYVLAFDLSTNNITIPDLISLTTQDINLAHEYLELSIANDNLVHQEPDDFDPANDSKPAETHIDVTES
ncbi:hypothetical protein Tco_1129024 [Tanacetum coccineum]